MSSHRYTIEIHGNEENQVLGPFRLRFEHLVRICCWQKEDLVLEIHSGHKRGLLYFQSGELVHAAASGHLGKEAFHLIELWDDARFNIKSLERPVMRTISRNTSQLIQERQGISIK